MTTVKLEGKDEIEALIIYHERKATEYETKADSNRYWGNYDISQRMQDLEDSHRNMVAYYYRLLSSM